MFSIGEFARLSGVSVRTLRHYDEIGLLRPAIVDPDTSYRGYSASQLDQINRVIALKELGFSLMQVGQLLDGVTIGELRGMLTLRRPRIIFYEFEQADGVTVALALPVAEPPAVSPHLPASGSCLRSRPPSPCAAARPRPRSLGTRQRRPGRPRPAGIRDPAAVHPAGALTDDGCHRTAGRRAKAAAAWCRPDRNDRRAGSGRCAGPPAGSAPPNGA